MTEEEKQKKEQEETDKKAMETIVEVVSEKSFPILLEKFKNEQPLRKQIFGDGSSSEKAELAARKEAAAEYVRKMAQGQETKALSSGTATSGLELVPTYLSDNVITIAEKYGLVRKHAMKWPMQGLMEDVPTVGTVQAYRLATDTSTMIASQPTTGAVQLRAKTIGVMIPISKTLLMNATGSLMDILAMLAGRAIAKLEDQWGLLGLAAGEGIFQNTSVPVVTQGTGKDLYSEMVATDLLAVENVIDENFLNENFRWVMSHSVLNVLRSERAAVGADLQGFLLPGYGENTPPTLWGHPYDTSAIMPKTSLAAGSQPSTKFLALVDWSNVIHGDLKQYTMEVSDQATIVDTDGSTLVNTFAQNMAAIKIWGQIDIKLANAASAFGVLKTAA